jgi:hypothetical protein
VSDYWPTDDSPVPSPFDTGGDTPAGEFPVDGENLSPSEIFAYLGQGIRIVLQTIHGVVELVAAGDQAGTVVDSNGNTWVLAEGPGNTATIEDDDDDDDGAFGLSTTELLLAAAVLFVATR